MARSGKSWQVVTRASVLLCCGWVLCYGLPESATLKSAAQTTSAPPGNFVDITKTANIQFVHQASHTSQKYLLETMGSGVALVDYDNDGRLDIFLANGAPLNDPTAKGTVPRKAGAAYRNRLYHQKKDGTFEDATEKAGIAGVGYDMGVATGDYDNDGFEDLFVTGYGGNHLYHNNGNGTFTDVTEVSGTAGSGWSTSAAWVDLDNDGLLDLVVLRYLKWDFEDIWCGEHREGFRSYCHPDLFPAVSPLVYHNDGHGHFTQIAAAVGLDKPGKGLGIGLADYDGDGHTDIFVANDSMLEFLYHNQGNGTFEEVGLAAGVAVDGDARTYAGMGVGFADYNNDGLPDLIVTDLANQKYALYRNEGGGTFSYTSFKSGLGRLTQLHSGWGVDWLDYDNDGWKDLIVAQGHDIDNIELTSPQLHYKESMLMLRNTGQTFVDVSDASGAVFQQKWVGRGLASGDIDNDGRIDVLVSTNDGPAHLLRNETRSANHWLTLRLTGHKSNRDGIGAEIKLTTSVGSQYLTVSTCGSYLSAKDKRPHIGLGADPAARLLEIHWPSGIVQVLDNVRGDQILEIEEPPGSPPRK